MATAMLKIKVDGLVQQHASAMRILRYEYGVDIPSTQCIPTPPTTSDGVLDLLRKQSYRNSEDFKMDVVRAYLDSKWYKDDGQGGRLLDKLDELGKKDPKHRPIFAAIREEFGLDPKNPHPRLVAPPPAPSGPKGVAPLRRPADAAGPSSSLSAPGPSSLSQSPPAPPYIAEDAQSAEIAALRELVQLQAAQIDELAGRVARIEGRANGADKQRGV